MASTSNNPGAERGEPTRGPQQQRSGWLGRLLRDPFRLALFASVNLALVVGFASTVAIWRFRRLPPKPATVQMALQALDRGQYAAARRIAERVIAQGDVATEDWGGPDYVLGAFVARAAEKAAGKRRAELFDLASRFLEQSRKRGFPKGRQDAGLYMLGKCLCACGRAAAAQSIVEQALKSPKSSRVAELRRMLIASMLERSVPDLPAALAVADRGLAEPALTDDERHRATMERVKVLLRMGRLPECASALESLPADGPMRGDILALRGEFLYRQALAPQPAKDPAPKDKAAREQVKTKLQQAIDCFRGIPGLDDPNSDASRRALYLTGVCLRDQGDLRAAFSQFDRTCRLIPGTAEGVAAAFQEGEVARQLDRPADALLAYRTLTQAAGASEDLQNPWVSAPQLRKALLSACQDYVAAGKYDMAAELAKALPPFFSRGDAMEALARVYRSWGQKLLDQAETLPPQRAATIRSQGRQQLRKAGVCYSAVAVSNFTSKQFPDQLFLSAESYLAGNDFRNAIRVFEQYLHYEPRMRHAQVLVNLGDAQLSAGKPIDALESLMQCIRQHPRDVAVYRARLLASRAASAVGDAKRAAALLQENLDGDNLTPASKEWRESLFAFGELLHSQGRYDEAIRRLQEALTRYPTAAQALVARYLLADASRRSAAALRAGLPKEISATLRAEHAAEADRLFGQAADGYRQLRDALNRKDERDMTAHERAILRNSQFALGETLYALGQYPEALRAYQSAANAYPNNPEVIEAFAEIANVYTRMNQPTETRAALEQARLALRRIPPQAAFTKTTNYDRAQWGKMLDWMCNLQP